MGLLAVPSAAQTSYSSKEIFAAALGNRGTGGDPIFFAVREGLVNYDVIEQVSRNPRICEILLERGLPPASTALEPVTLVLLGTGLLVIGMVARRTRARGPAPV